MIATNPSVQFKKEKWLPTKKSYHFIKMGFNSWGETVIVPCGHTTSYVYNIVGGLASLTDAYGETRRTLCLTSLARRMAVWAIRTETDRSGNTWTYSYDEGYRESFFPSLHKRSGRTWG